MAEQAPFALASRNPDVLTSIANLSNDEVFTPPGIADQMLDLLEHAWASTHDGSSIWANPSLKFLDPFAKSGVFLRQITSRLINGLEGVIPDRPKRVDHILTTQVYGAGITNLTSLLARRTVYCTKWANGPHTVAPSINTRDGNIWFERTEHSWVGGRPVETADTDGRPITKLVGEKCVFCGATQQTLDRDEALETHAYALIHTDDVRSDVATWFGEDMQFDVIIGNPPFLRMSVCCGRFCCCGTTRRRLPLEAVLGTAA